MLPFFQRFRSFSALAFYFLFSLLFTATAITSSAFAAEILSVSPDFIKMRHAAVVTVKIKNDEKNIQLSLIPGGAFISKTKQLENISIIHRDMLITIEDKTSIVIYKATKSAWQEIGFAQLNMANTDLPIEELFVSQNNLYIKTKNTLLTVNIKNPSLPKLVSSATLKNPINSFSATSAIECIANQKLLTLKTKSTAITATQENGFSQVIAFKQFCVSLNQSDGIQVWGNVAGKLRLISHYKSNAISREFVLANDLIAVADGTTGITLLNITDLGKIHWKGSYNKLGNIIHVAYSDRHVLAADNKGVLSVFDISNPATPLLISDFHTHLSISALQFHQKQGYLIANVVGADAVDNKQKQIVNVDFVSNSSPLISTLGVNQGGSRRSFIDNDILYVADWFSGLHLYDIRNPFSPRLLSSFHTPGSPKGVVVKNGVAFVADDDHGLQIIDVSNPRKPTFISEIPLTGLAYTMKLINDLLYIASHRGGFHIVDVSNPASPLLVSTYDTPSKAWALEYKDGLLYVADDSTGLMVFDVKDPSQPKLINQFSPLDINGKNVVDNGFAEDVILKDNKAYIAFFGLGLVIVDISDPRKLKQLAVLPTPGNARGIEIRDDLLYLASWEAGVQIINIASDSNPHIIGHYDTKGAVWGLGVKDNIVYALDWWGGVKVIDATQANRPTLVSQYQTAGLINDLQYYNRFIYTAHGSRGLQVYDASNDLNPVWATGVDISGDAKAIVINQDQAITLAIIAAGDAGVAIANIEKPFHSHLLGQLNLGASISFVQTKNNLVFAAEKNGDLFIINIQNPRAPILLKRISLSVNQLTIKGDKLFILNNNQTLSSYFVNKLTIFSEAEQYKLPTVSNRLHFFDNTHFISAYQNQLHSCSIENKLIECGRKIKIPSTVLSMHVVDNMLYATTSNNDLYVFSINTNGALKLSVIYPTSHSINSISTSNAGIFFGGQAIIASGKLLPKIKINAKNNQFNIHIPNNMPKGAYHLALTHADGQQTIRKNAVIIGFPKLKSKFTLEQLKAIMKQKNFDGKAPVAP